MGILSLLSHAIGQTSSQGQPRSKEYGNGPYLLMERATQSISKGMDGGRLLTGDISEVNLPCRVMCLRRLCVGKGEIRGTSDRGTGRPL